MRDESKDPARLDHILDAAKKLHQESQKEGFYDLTEKDLSYYGVVKLLEIIGEAAYKLSNEFKENHPDTPWRYVVGMRHVLVHGYYQINSEDVFHTIRFNLPELIAQIEDYLKEYDI